MILVVVFGFIIIAYGFIITIAMLGWSRLSYFKADPKTRHSTRVSVIVPARNEAETITLCLKELVQQHYPAELLEIIVVDDASDDDTLATLQAFASRHPAITIISQPVHAGKKKCLADGIARSNGSLVVTSDADMFGRSLYWLQTIVSYYERYQPRLMILPLSYSDGGFLLGRFQIVENLALAGITGGYAGMHRPFLCNGANLAFTREAFESVGGYSGHLHVSSGEDVFLLEDVKKKYSAGAIHYVFSRQAIARTYALRHLGSLFRQRLRWAYKAKYSPNKFNALVGFIVVAANLVFPALFVGMIQRSPLISYLSIFATAKVVFDFLLLFLASDFLGLRSMLLFLLPFECIYWVYATAVGLSSLVVKPKWKNRQIH